MKLKLYIIFLALAVHLSSPGSTINIYTTNYVSGFADTNYFKIVPVGSNTLANGAVVTKGIPILCWPNTNGFFSTNLQVGNYQITNAYVNLLFQSFNDTNSYNIGDVLLPGFNTFAPTGIRKATSVDGTIALNPANGVGVVDFSVQGGSGAGFFRLSSSNNATGSNLFSGDETFTGYLRVTNTATTPVNSLLSVGSNNIITNFPNAGGGTFPMWDSLNNLWLPGTLFGPSDLIVASWSSLGASNPGPGQGFNKPNNTPNNTFYAAPAAPHGQSGTASFRALDGRDFASGVVPLSAINQGGASIGQLLYWPGGAGPWTALSPFWVSGVASSPTITITTNGSSVTPSLANPLNISQMTLGDVFLSSTSLFFGNLTMTGSVTAATLTVSNINADLIAGPYFEPTAALLLPSSAPPGLLGQISMLWNSNGTLYWVNSTSTNALPGSGGGGSGSVVVAGTDIAVTTNSSTSYTVALSVTVVTNSMSFTTSGTAQNIMSIAHGFGAVPQFVRWVLVCSTANQGYAVNDEIPIDLVFGTTALLPFFSPWANATNMGIGGSNDPGIEAQPKNGGAYVTLTTADWRLKCYVLK